MDYPTAWFPDAVANLNLGKFEQAVKAAREAVKADPQHTVPRAEYVLGMALAETRDMKGAAAALKDYLAHTPSTPDAERVKFLYTNFTRQGLFPARICWSKAHQVPHLKPLSFDPISCPHS